jgi:predicted RNase H-like nuclease (RuvC/YqgF family)
MESLAERVINEIEADKRLRKRLAELLVTEPDVRILMINSIIADVAKKEDIRELRGEINQLRGEISQLRGEMNQLREEMKQEITQLRGEINQLREEINQLREEMHSDFKWVIGIILTIWGATVIPILLRLIGAI